jgi:integral membrane protein
MTTDAYKPVNNFRRVAVLEGWSFIILLFIAMPFKYMLDFPLMVKYVGWIHGALFIAYVLLMINASIQAGWKFGRVIWAFVASLLPFGTFVLDRQLKRELKA